MKRTRILLVAFAAILSVGMVSCDKDNNNDGDNTGDVKWVDLGLPSGLLWADCNLGANAPEEKGKYYAWGETAPKEDYDWSTYVYGKADTALTKYCTIFEYGNNGFTDNLTTLEAMDDAATAALGSGSRIPTKADWEELIANTTFEWTTVNGVSGRKYTAANGNTLFLPAAGYQEGPWIGSIGSYGYYWSSSLDENVPFIAWSFLFANGTQTTYLKDRYYGFSVRPVRSAQ